MSFVVKEQWLINQRLHIAPVSGNVLQAQDADETEKKKKATDRAGEAGTASVAAGLSRHG